tara:strand:+ start:324 stop:728 length:405 start_codon:yes stop_codon:yes gene_type:complete
MVKRKKYSFTDLNFTKEDLARNSQQVIAKVGYHLLLRVKKRTAINAVWGIKILAKGQKVRSIKKVIGFKTRTALKGLKTVGRRAKTGITKRTRRKTYRKSNGRTIQKSKRRSKQFVKGSPQAKAWGRKMAKLRA